VFLEQRSPGVFAIWAEPFTRLRLTKLFNLRLARYERAKITSDTYYNYFTMHIRFLLGHEPKQRPAWLGARIIATLLFPR
jgi:arylsulfatase